MLPTPNSYTVVSDFALVVETSTLTPKFTQGPNPMKITSYQKREKKKGQRVTGEKTEKEGG